MSTGDKKYFEELETLENDNSMESQDATTVHEAAPLVEGNKKPRVKYRYWQDKGNCAVEALKHSSRKKFEMSAQSAYKSSLRNGWLDEICGHMRPKMKRKDVEETPVPPSPPHLPKKARQSKFYELRIRATSLI
jgi:hypothetical protein